MDHDLAAWVAQVAALTRPDRIVWTDGSEAEWARLTDSLVAAGTFTRLAAKPNSFHCASDPSDVARVEDRTFICSIHEADAGPTNNWMDPAEMKAIMTGLYDGCMAGRTMYVVPFCMGPLDAASPMLGVEITDSEYVVASMRVMTRMGTPALELINDGGRWVRALHSLGAPLAPGQRDVAWPCNDTKYITQFPEERTIWSFGSGYGGNALLGKKVLLAADRLGAGQGALRGGRVPECLRQDQSRDARADDPGLEGRDPRGRHRLDDIRVG